MKKKGLLVLGIALIAFIAFSINQYQQRPIRIHPFSYDIKNVTPTQQDAAETADILIIGDSMAKELKRYEKRLKSSLSKNLTRDINVYNWSERGEGVHRTLHKLKSLKRAPKVILYYGQADLFYEKTFEINDYQKILKNLRTAQDEIKMSIIMSIPWLSKILYENEQIIQLNTRISKDKDKYDDIQRQKQIELGLLFFKEHLALLQKEARMKGSHLVLMTTPINLSAKPRKTCSNANTEDVQSRLKRIVENKFKKSKSEVINNLIMFTTENPAHAHGHYILGNKYLESGELQKAKDTLYLSSVYDCLPWRANHITNTLIRNLAASNGISMIDFDKQVNSSFGQDVLFLDDQIPQGPYYYLAINELEKIVRKTLSLR